MNPHVIRPTLLGLLAAAALTGCAGYTHSFALPPGAEDAKTVAVDLFKNKTLYTGVEFEFASALEKEINAKTPLTVARRGDADTVIKGSIDDYKKVILRQFTTNDVARYSIVLTLTYQFIRLPAGGAVERVVRSGTIERSAEYEVLSNETEATARAEAVRKIARKVVSQMFETW